MIQLYRAKLYLVKNDVDYFSAKKLVEYCPTWCSDVKVYLDKVEPKTIKIGDEKYSCKSIFLDVWSYYLSNICKVNSDISTRMDEYSIYKYYDCHELIVLKQFGHRLKDVMTGLVFPEVQSKNPLYYNAGETRVFKANKRVYANIVGEVKTDEIEEILNGITKEELNGRKQKLLYIMEQAEKHWKPLPFIHERIKDSILKSDFIRTLEERWEEIEQARLEEERKRQYVKKIEQMRKENRD